MADDELTEAEREELEDLAEKEGRIGRIARAWLEFEDED